MNRQYIGARYVPKIFSSVNGSEWVEGIPYESLTIVTYLNNSYTSLKNVPASAGNPKDAKEYWVLTGNYNAQVEEYRIETNKLSENVETLSGKTNENDVAIKRLEKSALKNGIIIGDSYTTHDPNSGEVTYPLNFGEILKEKGYLDNVFSYGVNGARYSLTSTHNFKSQLEEAVNDSNFENDDVDYIIIEGGQNERFESDYAETVTYYLKLYKEVQETIKYAKLNFKNAKIYCVPIFWNGVVAKAFQYRTIWNAIYNSAMDNGAIIDRTSLYWGLGVYYTWGTDNTHPTYETLQKMVNKCGNLINGGKNLIDTQFVIVPETNLTQCKVMGYNVCEDSIEVIISGYNTTEIVANAALAYIYEPFIDTNEFLIGSISSYGDNTAMFAVKKVETTGVVYCLKTIPSGERFTVKIHINL